MNTTDPPPALPRPPLWLFAAALLLVLWLALFYVPLFFGRFPGTIDPLDFALYYVGAEVGLRHGWAHVYDLALQERYFELVRPGDLFDWHRYFVSPPPVAWLVAPLTSLPLDAAYWVWTAGSTAAFIAFGWAAAPGRALARGVVLLAGAGLYPVLLAVQNGNVALLVGAGALLGWWLLRHGRPGWAGVTLALLALKPQVAGLVPLALLLAGRRRTFLAAAAAAGALALASLATLGADGFGQLRADLAQESGRAANLLWTLRVLAPAPVALALQLLAAAAALLAAWSARRRPDAVEVAFAAGIAGTLLAAPYHNASDYLAVVPATWLLLRAGRGRLGWAWAAFGLLACYAAAPLGPLPLIVFTAGLLALCYRRGDGEGVGGAITTRPERSERYVTPGRGSSGAPK